MKAKVSIVFLMLSIYTSTVTSKFSFYDLANVVNEYVETGYGSYRFWNFLNATRLQNPLQGRFPEVNFNMLQGVREETANLVRGVVTCAMCNMGVNMALSWLHAGATREQLVEKIVTVCATFNLQKKHVCRGLAEVHIDVFLWIIEAKNGTPHPVTPADVCGLALYPRCPLPPGQYEWSLDLGFLGPKPAVLEPAVPPEGSPTLKVLQITDVHVDPMYLPGGNARCGEPCCCRANQEPARRAQDAAGFWGDYRDCDLPVHTFQNMLRHAAKAHPDIAYVMFTGDVVDHGVWATSVGKNRDTFSLVMDELRLVFPHVTVLPVLGNHEPHPLNAYSEGRENSSIPAELSSSWLYDLAADKWGAWLPEQRATIARAGYYKHEVRPGLLVVVVNNNVCYNFNWWQLYSNFDPSGQLVWLAETLLAAEGAGQKVHILAHIAGNSKECLASWRTEYQRIIHRFENTVVAQFHGHTHYDHFNIYYDLEDPSRATNVAFTAGSGTTFSDVNPNYRLYIVDGEREQSTYRVLDHETWFFNLTEANLAGPDVAPNWRKLYSFRQAYGVPSLLPADLDALAQKMAKDNLLQDQYYSHYVKLGDTSLTKGCNSKCRRDIVCDIMTPDPDNPLKCRLLMSQGYLRVLTEDEVPPPQRNFLDEELDDELEALLGEVEGEEKVQELEIVEMADILQGHEAVVNVEDKRHGGNFRAEEAENGTVTITETMEDMSGSPFENTSDIQLINTSDAPVGISDITVVVTQLNDAPISDSHTNDDLLAQVTDSIKADDATGATIEDTIVVPENTIFSPEDTIVTTVFDKITEIQEHNLDSSEDKIDSPVTQSIDLIQNTRVVEESVTEIQEHILDTPEDKIISPATDSIDLIQDTVTAQEDNGDEQGDNVTDAQKDKEEEDSIAVSEDNVTHDPEDTVGVPEDNIDKIDSSTVEDDVEGPENDEVADNEQLSTTNVAVEETMEENAQISE